LSGLTLNLSFCPRSLTAKVPFSSSLSPIVIIIGTFCNSAVLTLSLTVEESKSESALIPASFNFSRNFSAVLMFLSVKLITLT